MKNQRLSFVVPLYNEEEVVRLLVQRVKAAAETMGMDWELVCINDGSRDKTLEILKELHAQEPRLKVVSFSRNFGHQIAVVAGLRYATGDCVAVIDGDLQDPPEVVGEMLKKWQEGFHVVYGVRQNRKEVWWKRQAYALFYRLLSRFSSIDLPVDAGDFCLMDRKVVQEMNRLNEHTPYVRGLRAWVGFRQTPHSYDRPAREYGESKYTLFKLMKLALSGFMSFSDQFLNAAIFIGLKVTLLSLLYGGWMVVNRILIALGFTPEENLIPGWTSLISLLAFLMGLMFLYIGILGKYLGNIFIQVKNRPLFVVEEALGFEQKPSSPE